MLRKLLHQIKVHPPGLTLLFVASMMLTTLPQFFLPGEYNTITGTLPSWDTLYYLTLPVFSHSPSILFAHLLVNTLVFLLFGSLSEILLGPRRFALVTLTTWITSQLLCYLKGIHFIHGISGVGWGYHLFGLFFLVLFHEKNSKAFAASPLTYVLSGLILVNFLGIPAYETLIQGWPFLENFGQYIHLASVVVCIPYVLLWRQAIEEHYDKLVNDIPITYPAMSHIPVLLVYLILGLNAIGTLIAIVQTLQGP